MTAAEVSALKVTVTMGHDVYGELNSTGGCSLSSSGGIDAGGRWKSRSSRLFKTVVFKNLPRYSPLFNHVLTLYALKTSERNGVDGDEISLLSFPPAAYG